MSALRGKRALVTGGAGFIGSNLALELERLGASVVVVDDFSVGHFENLAGFGGDVVAADLGDVDRWAARVGPVSIVFHQAANTDTTVSDQKTMMEANVEAFRAVLGFALQSGVGRVIYASSAGVYGAGKIPMQETDARAPMNVYGFSKLIMENVARQWAEAEPTLKLAGLRYFNVYGPREANKAKAASMIWQLYLQMKAGKRPRVFKFGEQYRDFIYVKDVVAANLAAAEAAGVEGFESGRVFNVCTGRKATFNEVIRTLNEVLRADLKPDYFDNPYSFYQNETLGDPELARDRLNFTAQYTIDAGIRDYFGAQPVPVGAR